MTAVDERPPSFLRRHLAATADDPDVLVGLACDESLWVRREAARNPATPRWVLDLLVRAGAEPGLWGRGAPDPDLTASELRRLVEGGSWAQQLVVDHPNACAEILDALAAHPAARVRTSVAGHANATPGTLAVLLADGDDSIRRKAARHPTCPDDVRALMERAARLERMRSDELVDLARLGPWGRYLAGRHPACPAELVAEVARDPDWRIRSAVLENPATSSTLVAAVAGDDESAVERLRWLAVADVDPLELVPLADHPAVEVRLAVARHSAVPASVVRRLAVDRVAEVRRLAAGHPLMDADELSRLVRAGSSDDLARLAAPDPSITAADLDVLARGGYWARQLAARHPDASPSTLAHLLCDADPKLREWAAAHPSAPADVVELIHRVGGASDFQGVAEPDHDATPAELQQVAALGPWGAWVVAWHPNASEELARERDQMPVP